MVHVSVTMYSTIYFQALTSAEIALVVICVLIFVIFVALAAFLYCTGRLIGCGIGGGGEKKRAKGSGSADAKKKAEAEKRLRDIRCACAAAETIYSLLCNNKSPHNWLHSSHEKIRRCQKKPQIKD